MNDQEVHGLGESAGVNRFEDKSPSRAPNCSAHADRAWIVRASGGSPPVARSKCGRWM